MYLFFMENNKETAFGDSKTISSDPERQTSPDGTLDLVLALVGLFLFLPLCIASFMISKDDKEKCASLGVEPNGSVTAAYIVSIIGIAVMAFGALILILLLLGLVAFSI